MARIVDRDGHEVEVLRRLVSFRGMNVLDVGCGDGRTVRTIAREAASVIGVDPDTARIAVARAVVAEREACPVDYRSEDIVASDFPAASFDAVVFTRSL